MEEYWIYVVYALPLAALYLIVLNRRTKLSASSHEVYRESIEAGLTQPPSLHPVVNPNTCIGCESCIHACPEYPVHHVLGLIKNKATLVSPTDCIGHGACKTVCPVNAISLVFGTAERGIDIPNVNPDFSTNADGVFIAGELGGMGLIRNAINQGREAIGSIGRYVKKIKADPDCLDVLIVGAGPAGMAAALGAMEAKMKYKVIEQNSLGGTVASFPRGKLVMTAPVNLPLVGEVNFTETSKEELIDFWSSVQSKTQMKIQTDERLIGVEKGAKGVLLAKTDKGLYPTRSLLLAIGRRGTPRKLGVPGEEFPKVTYSLSDPAQYRDQSVLVVGGGDSALEAACSIAELGESRVTLSYRSATFSRAKLKNRQRVEKADAAGLVQVLMSSKVTMIEESKVLIEHEDELLDLQNDAIIVCAGGILPDWLLKEIGIEMETKHGTA